MNKATGGVYIWFMNGINRFHDGFIYTLDNLDWQIMDVGDFSGDGKADVLWRNKATGQVYIWLVSMLNLDSEGSPDTVSDSNWQIYKSMSDPTVNNITGPPGIHYEYDEIGRIKKIYRIPK